MKIVTLFYLTLIELSQGGVREPSTHLIKIYESEQVCNAKITEYLKTANVNQAFICIKLNETIEKVNKT